MDIRKRQTAPICDNTSPVQERYSVRESDTILQLLQRLSGRSRTAAKQLLTTNRICINGKATTQATYTPTIGSTITVHQRSCQKPFSHPKICIVWQDDDYILVEKKAGIYTVNTTHQDRTRTVIWILSQYLKESNPAQKLFMLNRLDSESAGFILFAKNLKAKENAVRQWGHLLREQRFILAVQGTLLAAEMDISATSATKETKGKKQQPKIVKAHLRQIKSSSAGNLHIVEVSVGASRIFSLRKLVSDNGLQILGDGRNQSNFGLKGKIALEQTKIVLRLPNQLQQELSFTRPFPSHFYTYLRYDTPSLNSNKPTKTNHP